MRQRSMRQPMRPNSSGATCVRSSWRVLPGSCRLCARLCFNLEYFEIALESQRDEQAAARHGCCCLQTTTSVFRRMGPPPEAIVILASVEPGILWGRTRGVSMRCIGAALTIAMIAVGLMPAGAADLPVKAIYKAPPPPLSGGFWIGAEYLLWSAKGDKLPPLVTTSPAGTPAPLAGVLGTPGTSVLFGDSSVNDRWRSGVRVSAGYWFDPLHTTGIEANFFMLNPNSTGFAASSNGNAILARPFVDAITGLPAAQLIAFPGFSAGSVAINDTSRLLGAGAAYRTEFCRSCAFGSVSGLIGYRYLHLRDSLVIAG